MPENHQNSRNILPQISIFPQMKLISEPDVDTELDSQIRNLLTVCFPKESRFRHQRFCWDMPRDRWLILEGRRLVGHAAAHFKQMIDPNGQTIEFGGVAEVCVHPDYRGRGIVKSLTENMHRHFIAQNLELAGLIGNIKVYQSSGYIPAKNVYYESLREKPVENFLVRPLGTKPWPDSAMYLIGDPF